MSDNSFAPNTVEPGYGQFIVQNITTEPKVVRIFNYPILPGGTRNLLAIPGVAESDIRVSLLKGEINVKLLAGEVIIIASDIDLLQFNLNQFTFLSSHGVATGMQVGILQQAFIWNEDVRLTGTVDGVNTVFTIPSGVFVYSGYYKIIVYLNGVKQVLGNDFTISMSTSLGYDTITFAIPPPLYPTGATITADYWTGNNI
jgi:hypothetical protein